MAFTEIDEKLLVRAYQAGDERAFDTIVRTQYNALYAHALRRLSQHEAAEDAVQDTMLRAYRALPNLDGDLALRAWLHRILTNVCYDEGNRRRRQQGLVEKVGALPEEVAADPIEEAVLHDTVRVMSEALKDLPDSYREALVLRYVDGLSFREVAEATGISEENARARVQRGKSALHKIMSRLAVMVAFIIPGLKRTEAAGTAASDQAVTVSDHAGNAVNLTTQLTSHVMSAAPTMSRFAELSASMSGGKSALAAAAVTAVAAVSVPVAVHQVQESNKPQSRPPVTAAPTDKFLRDNSPSVDTAGTTPGGSTTSSSSSTSSTLPPSQAHPFEVGVDAQVTPTTLAHHSDSTTTTSTTVPTPAGTTVEGRLGGDSIKLTGEAPQWGAEGPVALVVSGKTTAGTVSGHVFVSDEGDANSDDLAVTLGGKSLELRFRGTAVKTTTSTGAATYTITGQYLFKGAAVFGLVEQGELTLVFRVGDGGATGSVAFDLRGRSS